MKFSKSESGQCSVLSTTKRRNQSASHSIVRKRGCISGLSATLRMTTLGARASQGDPSALPPVHRRRSKRSSRWCVSIFTIVICSTMPKPISGMRSLNLFALNFIFLTPFGIIFHFLTFSYPHCQVL